MVFVALVGFGLFTQALLMTLDRIGDLIDVAKDCQRIAAATPASDIAIRACRQTTDRDARGNVIRAATILFVRQGGSVTEHQLATFDIDPVFGIGVMQIGDPQMSVNVDDFGVRKATQDGIDAGGRAGGVAERVLDVDRVELSLQNILLKQELTAVDAFDLDGPNEQGRPGTRGR